MAYSSVPDPSPLPAEFHLNHVPFLAHLGVRIESLSPGVAVLFLDPRPEHYNSWGGVHGGVVMTLLDVCMAVAGRAHDPMRWAGVTVDLSSSFIAPGKGTQLATGRVIAQTRSLWRCEGEVRNASDNTLVAKSLGTFKFRFIDPLSRKTGEG